jgi:hypothetical protein
MDYPLEQSAWRRGWNDTKTAWKSLPFIILDSVVCAAIGSIFEWYWGLALFIVAMFCVWIGATASAPIRQRNEVRNVLLDMQRPKPITNKDAILRAISTFCECAIMEFTQREVKNEHSCAACPLMEPSDFIQSYRSLSAEKLVAGGKADEIVSRLMTFVLTQLVAQLGDECYSAEALSREEFLDKLGKMRRRTIKGIQSLS